MLPARTHTPCHVGSIPTPPTEGRSVNDWLVSIFGTGDLAAWHFVGASALTGRSSTCDAHGGMDTPLAVGHWRKSRLTVSRGQF